ELLSDSGTHLRSERLRVQPGGEPLDEWQQQRCVAGGRVNRPGYPGVLDLHGHVVAVDRSSAMDLADRGRGKRALVEVAEHLPQRRAELLPHELFQIRELHWRDVVA